MADVDQLEFEIVVEPEPTPDVAVSRTVTPRIDEEKLERLRYMSRIATNPRPKYGR